MPILRWDSTCLGMAWCSSPAIAGDTGSNPVPITRREVAKGEYPVDRVAVSTRRITGRPLPQACRIPGRNNRRTFGPVARSFRD